jgi:hypothetical protein
MSERGNAAAGRLVEIVETFEQIRTAAIVEAVETLASVDDVDQRNQMIPAVARRLLVKEEAMAKDVTAVRRNRILIP